MAGGATPELFSEVILLLGGAVVAAPLFKKLGLGTVLGYLAAGIIVGPVLRLITDPEAILQFSELGIVFLLFIIGLELKPQRLWSLRRDIFGLGFTQVMLSGFIICGFAMALAAQNFAAALVIGFGLALSSTAFAIQMLEERGELNLEHGRKAFSILLFQDLAIVPLLAIIPLLAPTDGHASGTTTVTGLLNAIFAVGLLLLAGRFLLTPLFRIVGNSGAREAMIAAALLVVLGAAYLMQLVGLSMAMGAFIAGVMLADSSFRHELEADIEPFRGLLLGLFFIAIGMKLNLDVLLDQWLILLVAVPLVMLSKGLVIFGLTRLYGNSHNVSVRTAFALPQGGEFGFVLFSTAAAIGIFSRETASLLIAIAVLTMVLTPLLMGLVKYLVKHDASDEMAEDYEGADEKVDVLMIGFSRFGQIASQALLSGGRAVTIIDNSAQRVQSADKFGFRIYYGDGTRKEVLEAAGIRNARIVAVVTHNKEITSRVVNLIQSNYPEVRLFVRSYDRTHTLALRRQHVEYELRETFESGLKFGAKTLEALGMTEDAAHMIADDVRKRDEERLLIQQLEGMTAGGHMMYTQPVSPEPLTKPNKTGKIVRIDDKTHTTGANG